MNTEHNKPFDEVIDEIVTTEPAPSYEALLQWTTKYPEHRADLEDFFANWTVQKAQPPTEGIDKEGVGRRMVSAALDLLHQQTAAAEKTEVPAIARLGQAIKARGLTLEGVAARTNLGESILIKLDRRRISFRTIPRKCFVVIAAAIEFGVEFVMSLCQGEPVPVGANKTHTKPDIKVEDFLAAVEASELGPEAKAEWVRIATLENPNEESP